MAAEDLTTDLFSARRDCSTLDTRIMAIATLFYNRALAKLSFSSGCFLSYHGQSFVFNKLAVTIKRHRTSHSLWAPHQSTWAVEDAPSEPSDAERPHYNSRRSELSDAERPHYNSRRHHNLDRPHKP
jgi:hypothetical protein